MEVFGLPHLEHDGVGILGDAVVATSDTDVAALTPRGAPSVLDGPVLLAVLLAPRDGEHRVVEEEAVSVVEDAAGVELPLAVGADADHGGAVAVHVLGEGVVGLLDVGHARELGGDAVLVELAGLLDALIRVVRLELDAADVGDVLDSALREAAVAALAAVAGLLGGAVDELLRRQLHEVVAVDRPDTLDVLCSRERPARPALPLVLHGRDRAVLSPVERGGEGGAGRLGGRVDAVLLVLSLGHVGELEEELLLGHVGERGDAVGGAVLLGVVPLDSLQVLLEDLESHGTLLGGGVLLLVLDNEVVELLRRGQHAGDSDSEQKESEGTHGLCFSLH